MIFLFYGGEVRVGENGKGERRKGMDEVISVPIRVQVSLRWRFSVNIATFKICNITIKRFPSLNRRAFIYNSIRSRASISKSFLQQIRGICSKYIHDMYLFDHIN